MKFVTLISLLLISWANPQAHAEIVKQQLGELSVNANLQVSENWPAGTTLLITHGTLSHRASELIEALQALFSEYDISSLAINLSLGMDNRQGPFNCDAIQRHKHEDAAAEISNWVTWLKAQGANNVVVLGHSRGGNQTARFVASRPDAAVSRMILLAPALLDGKNTARGYQKTHGEELAAVVARARALTNAGKPHALLTHTGFLYCPEAQVEAASFLSYYELSPRFGTVELLRKIKLPTLVITGGEDTTVPGISRALSPLANKNNLKIIDIEGADHFFRDLYADELVEQTAEWLNTPH